MNLLTLVIEQLSERRLRSSLTVLGIGIGIASLVSLILLSGSLQGAVSEQFESFGTDEILIAPGESIGPSGPAGTGSLTTDDLAVVERVPGVSQVIPVIRRTLGVVVGSETRFVRITGAPPDEAEEFLDRELRAGRYMFSDERRVAMIGSRIAQGAFDDDVIVGSRIEIDGDDYRVVAIFEETGTLVEDEMIVVPIESLRASVEDPKAVTAARAVVTPGSDIALVEERIDRALERYRGEDDIETTTPAQIIDQVGGFIGVVNVVVYSIAGVSLLVAGMGIMNSLFTSVLQRTREIGTMKAIGATNQQIMLVFLSESAILGFAGGVLGVLLGLGAAAGFVALFNSFGIYTLALVVPPALIVSALAFSLVLGVLAGTLPAMNASRLDPVEALRHE